MALLAVLWSGSPPAQAAAPFSPQIELPFPDLAFPISVAVRPSGQVLVVDQTTHRVLQAFPGGTQQALPFTGLSFPNGVAVDSAGNVLVVDAGNDRVVRLPAGGGAQQTLPFGSLDWPQDIAVDRAGTVYVTDFYGHRVLRLPAGSSSPQELPFPSDQFPQRLAVDGRGNVYVTEWGQKVYRFPGGTGGPEVVVSGPVFGDIAADFEGNLYLSDTDGVWEFPVGWGEDRLIPFTGTDAEAGVTIGPGGDVVLVDQANDRVLMIEGPLPPTRGLLRASTSPAVPTQITYGSAAIGDSWALDWSEQPEAAGQQLCFRRVPGYATPPCRSVDITAGQTTAVSAAFTPQGYLRATTSPPVASQISVDGVPRNDWGVWTDLPVGSHQVCFGAVAGYTPPACQTVNLAAGATAEVTGMFTPTPGAPGLTGVGSLRVTTSPAVPAQITVDGEIRDSWGLNWLELAPGSHEVCFSGVEGYTPPACSTVSVSAGQTTTVTGTFVPRGYLRVATSPASPGSIAVDGKPADAWGTWTDRPVGAHQVCFGAVAGRTTPPCQTVTVTAGATTTVTGTYGT